jgi:hypothetical protein
MRRTRSPCCACAAAAESSDEFAPLPVGGKGNREVATLPCRPAQRDAGDVRRLPRYVEESAIEEAGKEFNIAGAMRDWIIARRDE